MPFNLSPVNSIDSDPEAFIVQFRVSYTNSRIPPLSITHSLLYEIKSGLEDICYKCPMLKNGIDPNTAKQLPNQGQCLILSPESFSFSSEPSIDPWLFAFNSYQIERKISSLNWGGNPKTDLPTISVILKKLDLMWLRTTVDSISRTFKVNSRSGNNPYG